MEENLKSFHLSSVSKDLTTVGAVPNKKNPQKGCNDSHTHCVVDEESTIEKTISLQK